MSNRAKIYYRERDLLEGVLPFSSATLWRRIREGSFPAPIKFGSIRAWKVTEVHRWLESHTADSSATGKKRQP